MNLDENAVHSTQSNDAVLILQVPKTRVHHHRAPKATVNKEDLEERPFFEILLFKNLKNHYRSLFLIFK